MCTFFFFWWTSLWSTNKKISQKSQHRRFILQYKQNLLHVMSYVLTLCFCPFYIERYTVKICENMGFLSPVFSCIRKKSLNHRFCPYTGKYWSESAYFSTIIFSSFFFLGIDSFFSFLCLLWFFLCSLCLFPVLVSCCSSNSLYVERYQTRQHWDH